MKIAEELYDLSLELYRTRKEMAAYIQAINTSLFYELKRLKRVPAISNFVDLVSNYNLVLHIISPLSLQQANIQKEPIRCTFTTFQNMEHSARTEFGASEST